MKTEEFGMVEHKNGKQVIHRYKMAIHDSGRSNSKRSKQTNDCTVRALVNTTGQGYDKVYDILAAAGRKSGRGFHLYEALPRDGEPHTFLGHSFRWMPFPAIKGQRRMCIATFVTAHPKGVYIVRTAKHVLAAIDGVYHDTWAQEPVRCIYGAWEMLSHDARAA